MGIRRHSSSFFLSVAILFACTLGFFSAPAQAEVLLNSAAGTYTLQVRSYRDIPFRTTIRQQYDYSCGSAALATLLRFHYGRDVGETEIFKAMYLGGDQAKIQKVGFSLLDMKQYLENTGFKADGFRMTLDDVQKINTPMITLITIGPYKHFVVIKGMREGRVLVGDPALGVKVYTRAQFQKLWNGITFMIRDFPADKVAFNRDEEWNPWARAPSSERLDSHSLFGINTRLPTIYQVMQLTAMQPLPQ